MSVYTPLGDNEIRLLSLQPGAFNDEICASLKPALLVPPMLDSYRALSYVWGDASHLENITCNGISTNITKNLAQALRYIRSESQPCTLWADAICINQVDFGERNRQVSLMQYIYKKADSVIIWVGEADDATEDVMLWFQEFDKHFEDETHRVDLEYLIQQDKYLQMLAKVQAFVSRPWFHRAWTFQEACLASSAYVQCGHLTLPWLTVCSASIIARDMSIDRKVFGNASDHVLSLIYYSVMTKVDTEGFRLGSLLRQTRSRIAANPRDKIYSLLGLMSAVEVKVDYRLSVQQVYCTAVKNIISHDQNLDILSDSKGTGSNNELPTWTADWRKPLCTLPLCRHGNDQGVDGGVGPIFAAGPNRETPFSLPQENDISRLALKGFSLGTVSSILCLKPLMTDLQNDKHNWKKVFQLFAGFLEQTKLPDVNFHTKESSRISLLRTLSADTLPVTDKVGIAFRQKRFPWHHDWLRQEIDIDLKTFRKQRLVKHFGVDSMSTKAKYRSKAFNMSQQIVRVYEELFSEVLGHKSTSTSRWIERLWKLPGDPRPTQSYFSSETTRSRITVEMVDAVLEWVRGRSFISTDNGFIGMGPEHMVRGDLVYILQGAKVPFLLRPSGTNTGLHKMVGECYVHGIMYGESHQRRGDGTSPLKMLRPEDLVLI